MKNKMKTAALSLVIASSLITSSLTLAQENLSQNQSESDELTKSQLTEDDFNGGFLKIGYGYKTEISPYHSEVKGGSLFVNGRYQWEGLFVEAFYGANERNEGLSIGYNFLNTEQWSFDINTVLAHGEIKSEIFDTDKIFYQNFDSTQMVGLRATGNFDQSTVQFMLAPYSLNDELDKGVYASLWLGQSWQVKNWQFHSSLGFTYRSADILDHYYGISEEEASEHFQAYKAGSGVDITGQLSASYPISSSLLFESYIKYTDFASSINENPVMNFASKIDDRAEQMTEFGILVSYVF